MSQQVNSDALLKVNGMELSWVQPLTFLPVQGFGFTANYTRSSSATNNSGFIALGVPPTPQPDRLLRRQGISFRVAQTFTQGLARLDPGSERHWRGRDLRDRLQSKWTCPPPVDLSRFLGWKTDVSMSFDVTTSPRASSAPTSSSRTPFTIYDRAVPIRRGSARQVLILDCSPRAYRWIYRWIRRWIYRWAFLLGAPFTEGALLALGYSAGPF